MNLNIWWFQLFSCPQAQRLTRILNNNIRIRLLDTLPFGCEIHMQAVSPLGNARDPDEWVAVRKLPVV